MPVRQRTTRNRRPELTPDERAVLIEGDPSNGFAFFAPAQHMKEVWELARDVLLREWTATRPGTRPPGWWRFDWSGEPRLRLGGVGTPAADVLAYVPQFDRGVPSVWVDPWSVEYYNGRALDVNGRPIGTNYQKGDLDGVAPDPTDPPTFESEPAYLKRLGLLLPGEEERIPEVAFEPVSVDTEDLLGGACLAAGGIQRPVSPRAAPRHPSARGSVAPRPGPEHGSR